MEGSPTLKSVIGISGESWAEFSQGQSHLPERSPLEVLYKTREHVRSHVLMNHACTGVYTVKVVVDTEMLESGPH